MNVTQKKTLLIVLAVVLAVAMSFTCFTALALSSSDTLTYPMRTGDNALKNAPTIISKTEAVDFWQFFQANFGENKDLSGIDYLAIEMETVVGNPGMTVGVICNGARYGTYTSGDAIKTEAAYFVTESGTVTALNAQYDSINIGANAKGMLLLPKAKMDRQGGGEQVLTAVDSVIMLNNAQYNYGWQVKIGEIGYYVGDPAIGGTFTKIFDLSSEKKTSYYVDGITLDFPSDHADDVIGKVVEYPFAKGEMAFKNATVWAGPTEQWDGGNSDNWQTIRMAFDKGAVDLTDATYIAVQYLAKNGGPGLTYGIENNGTRYSIVGNDGKSVYMINENGEIAKTGSIMYAASNVSSSGALLIPMTAISYQFGNAANGLDNATNLVFTTNSRYNWNFEVGVGEIGYYTGTPGESNFVYHQLAAFDNKAMSNVTVYADNAASMGRLYTHKIDQRVYGDANLLVFGTGKTDDSIAIWTGGALGEQKMTTDTYGDDALLLTSKGPRENADAYTAFTIFDGQSADLTTAAGITLWARNDSDVEISFNLEVDCTGTEARENNARFNIKQGNRFWLYDVKTGKQTIYMTRPCLTLPVGFEGWVRVPLSAFEQAEWSAAGGAVPKEQFMRGNSRMTYIGITVFSGNYTDKSFAVNKIGYYTQTPSFVSALVPLTDTRKDIPTLMGIKEG